MAKLHFRYSAMNAGKSTYLLQIAHNYNEYGKPVELFTSAQDDRDEVGFISSRIGVRRQARTFHAQTDFLKELENSSQCACVLIDEAQFLNSAQVKQLHRWAHRQGVPVICFGLRSDFKGDFFEGSAALLTLADQLEEIKTVCLCGKKATMNMRVNSEGEKITEGEQVLIGGNDRYRQVCARCFYQDE